MLNHEKMSVLDPEISDFEKTTFFIFHTKSKKKIFFSKTLIFLEMVYSKEPVAEVSVRETKVDLPHFTFTFPSV